jgi:hypothetical protein
LYEERLYEERLYEEGRNMKRDYVKRLCEEIMKRDYEKKEGI